MMPFDFKNLDDRTRKFMLEEVEADISAGTLYASTRFSAAGDEAYPGLLREAVEQGDDASLTEVLSDPSFWKEEEAGANRKQTTMRVPTNRAPLFAEGQFNRFYTRGLCLRALEDKVDKLIVYRARESDESRPESDDRIGDHLDPQELLEGQRARVTDGHKLAWKPGSGLSVHLPE